MSCNKFINLKEAIRVRKAEQRLRRGFGNNSTQHSHTSLGNQPPDNTVIYIRDPKNKNGEIQHVSWFRFIKVISS